MIERPKWPSMTQMDLFDETLQKKIHRMEKWLGKIQGQVNLFNEEMTLMRRALKMSKKNQQIDALKKQIDQIDFFAS